MLATYLASKNSKDSDKYTFGGKQRGRRKRIREGQDDSMPEGTQSGSSGVIVYSPQSFTLDRALAIFIHIYSMHEDNRNGPEPDSMIYADKSELPNASEKHLDDLASYTKGGEGFFSMVCDMFN